MESALFGQILALLSALSFAASNVFIAHGARDKRDVESGIAFSIFVTMTLAFLVWLVLEGAQVPTSSAENMQMGIVWFALAGIFALVLGRSLVYASIHAVGVIRSSAVRRLNPLFSVLLAFIVLGETIAGVGVIGMVLITLAIGALVLRPFLGGNILAEREGHVAPVTYGWGIAAALAYAVSYLFRKFGLEDIGAPAFGTFVASVAGFVCYAALGLFFLRWRKAVLGMFSSVSPALVGAGILMSVGQLLFFAALFYERLSIVALIGSLEMFFATFLAVMFGTDKRPDLYTSLAGIVATGGVILMALAS